MTFLRAATLIVGLLSLQLSLAGDGAMCGARVHAAGVAASSGPGMAGMAGMPVTRGKTMPRPNGSQAPGPAHQPCDQHGNSHDCRGLTPCVAAFLASTAVAEMSSSAAFSAPAIVVRTPALITTAPETPPPRA